ncbi:MAG TPA: hypothetical protein VGK00_14640 [Anaerolineales bacterium]|jgi:hypothetical protein
MIPNMGVLPDQTVQTGPDEARIAPSDLPRRPFRRGEPCPSCGIGLLDYNGLIDLECPACGYTEGAGAGCT